MIGNEVAGTPGYMAIEVEQKGTADVLSDVFSAGVTLLELWVGSIGPTFDEYEGVDEVGPEGAYSCFHVQCSLAQSSHRRCVSGLCARAAVLVQGFEQGGGR